MKVNQRSVPKDMLSFEHKGYSVSVSTHRQEIAVHIQKDGKFVSNEWMTPEQFIALLTHPPHRQMSTQKNEHNPDNLTPEQVGEGWRLLGPDERQQPGDEWWSEMTHSWEENSEMDIGLRVCGDNTSLITYRRRITPPTDTTGIGREGETPETDAEMRRIEADEKEYEDRHDCYVALLKFARRLERQRDAAIAQVEALRRDVKAAERRAAIWMSMVHGLPAEINERFREAAKRFDDRAAIDSAQRQEGR